ncbi:hypothetical protein DSCA_53550 [Desulfosarcina alkanivorans]|uniref:Uncharacterized protein n=1 Tax=Desulfosarcina alkanivorans TaxID=571177 RepID=A0A5K7YSQ3_9BACT|nr:hypothetical protein [Desulfosarcina alkanivorans]BBO71425.1 hypothetical protein DSCA_53550 [Desulfosarcina alkanivorans]
MGKYKVTTLGAVEVPFSHPWPPARKIRRWRKRSLKTGGPGHTRQSFLFVGSEIKMGKTYGGALPIEGARDSGQRN